MLPYILTFIGMFLRQWYVNVITPEGGAAVFLTIVAIILTAVGLIQTYQRQGGKDAERKRLGIAIGIHVVIWLAGLLLFGAVSWILNKIVYLIALVIGIVICYFLFGSLNNGGSDKAERTGMEERNAERGGLDALPNIMYSDGYTRWQLEHRSSDHVVYHDDDGNTITIRQASVTGGNISTDVGTFQNYRA